MVRLGTRRAAGLVPWLVCLTLALELLPVFTGHWHANNITNYKSTELITSGPITFPLGEEGPGIRLIEVTDNTLNHRYIEL